MRLPLKNPISLILILLSLLTSSACKKETDLIEVDAFSNLQAKTTLVDNQYIISFQLTPFKYKEVKVRVSSNLSDFSSKPLGGLEYTVTVNSNYTCKVFLDYLPLTKKYYYQIMITDEQGNRILSDVFNLINL